MYMITADILSFMHPTLIGFLFIGKPCFIMTPFRPFFISKIFQLKRTQICINSYQNKEFQPFTFL